MQKYTLHRIGFRGQGAEIHITQDVFQESRCRDTDTQDVFQESRCRDTHTHYTGWVSGFKMQRHTEIHITQDGFQE